MKRVEDLEFRIEESLGNNPVEYGALVRWDTNCSDGKEFCYSVVHWHKGSEGWDAKFIGSRPFEYENKDLLWAMMQYGQTILDAEFLLEQEIYND